MQYQRMALMTVSMAYVEDDPSAALVEARLRTSGARIAARSWVTSTEAAVRAQLVSWISAPAIDGVIVCGDAADVAAAAVQPLVTEALSGGVLCGKKIVFVLPAMLGELADQLDRVVLPAIAARSGVPQAVGHSERIETDKIAVIGDLPAVADVVSLNLRTGGRRGLQLVALAGVAVAGGLCALAVNVLGRHDSIAVHHGAADRDVVEAAQPPSPPPVPAPPAVASQPPPAAPAPRKPSSRVAVQAPRPAPRATTPRAHATEEPHVTVPPELLAAPDDDDSCTEESCARHGNERECCTPFRTQAARLDQAHIARVTAALAPKVHDCRTPGAADGLVRVSVQVQPDGSVGKAAVLDAPEADVGSCVAAILRDTRFPATDEGGSFVYRIELAD